MFHLEHVDRVLEHRQRVKVVAGEEVAMEADHYMTATSGDSYWKGSARTNASDEEVQARALSIAELTPSYVYLSDVKERPLTAEEVEEFLG